MLNDDSTRLEQAHEDLDKAQGKLKHEQRFGSGMLKSVTIAVRQAVQSSPTTSHTITYHHIPSQ